MKRILSLFLTLIVCLGLCACGGGGKVELPVIPETQPSVPFDEPMQQEQTPSAPDNRMHYLEGRWILARETEGVPGELVFRADGQCTIDGKEYTWCYSYKSSSQFGVEVMEADAVKYTLSVGGYNGLESAMLIYTENDRGVYINPAHYDIIEITQENWQEYFEIRRGYYWNEDAFGEVTGLRGCGFEFALKEEYVPRLSVAVTGGNVLTKNAVELSFSYGRQPYELDLQNKICMPVEGQYTYKSTLTKMDNLTHHETVGYYKMSIWASGMDGVTEDTLPYIYDVTVLRANCPLYLLKAEYTIEY